MIFTSESTINEIISCKPQAKTLFEKYIGRPVADWEMGMAGGMTWQMVAGYIGWNTEKAAAVLEELNSL